VSESRDNEEEREMRECGPRRRDRADRDREKQRDKLKKKFYQACPGEEEESFPCDYEFPKQC
jgi:hypothetical protein